MTDKYLFTEEEKQKMLAEGFTEEQIRQVEEKRKHDAEATWGRVQNFANIIAANMHKQRKQFDDLTNREVFTAHWQLLMYIANNVCLAPQRRKFVVDDNNRDVLCFLLYYFNDCELAEKVFPGKGYKNHKNLLVMGNVGTGKTMMMQLFSEYLRATNNPNVFHNVSVTQMTNYFTIHNNIDRYTYNEEESRGFQSKPVNLCLNDIGVDNRPFYGIDTTVIVEDFLHARNEIWTQTAADSRKFAHLTTNLTVAQLKEKFADSFGRLEDRFKTYNVIKLTGESRR